MLRNLFGEDATQLGQAGAHPDGAQRHRSTGPQTPHQSVICATLIFPAVAGEAKKPYEPTAPLSLRRQ